MAFDGFLLEPTTTTDGEAAARLQRQAAVLAHDFNNLLGVILSASEALADRFPEGSDGHELAGLSIDAAEKGAALVRRLLDLSAPQSRSIDATDCDAAEAAASAVRLARRSVPAEVKLEHHVAEAPLPCAADRHALEAALLNLCVNAGHATAAGGSIVVTGETVRLPLAEAAPLALTPGAYVRLAVRDTGVGMSPDVLARAMEPWFTTRGDRGGTGLGLSGVADFARNAGGALSLASELGVGTTATLHLPCA